MTSSDPVDHSTETPREEFWRRVGTAGATRGSRGDADEPSRWPGGTATYRQVSTAHAHVVTTDGLSDPWLSEPGAGSDAVSTRGLGVELYIESIQFDDDDPDAGGWLVAALEESVGALIGAAASLPAALTEHEVLSLEVPGEGAPSEWVADGRLGVLLGVRLPGRPAGFDADGRTVRVLAVTPLRPEELAVVAAQGTAGRARLAAALADSGWYSYADDERPAVL